MYVQPYIRNVAHSLPYIMLVVDRDHWATYTCTCRPLIGPHSLLIMLRSEHVATNPALPMKVSPAVASPANAWIYTMYCKVHIAKTFDTAYLSNCIMHTAQQCSHRPINYIQCLMTPHSRYHRNIIAYAIPCNKYISNILSIHEALGI